MGKFVDWALRSTKEERIEQNRQIEERTYTRAYLRAGKKAGYLVDLDAGTIAHNEQTRPLAGIRVTVSPDPHALADHVKVEGPDFEWYGRGTMFGVYLNEWAAMVNTAAKNA